ncbi:ubiquitin-specific protease YUH1 [Ascoidea rubescens DSM 1968]|uniref:Ubiquitin carboxyl-terminal hydrolase n=1 Tax=Ascoidea rubescens DSM 1968 TaxID=1344418 RepID=A0A1D2VQ18_9ASCO|nr:ubiquitin carboxyl-terminal hydrolase 1 [Ascoidea rubescens DSM 1968]ODV63698.1 ubiquitin carboxyl-terminal hydrolase 1 [Ascoidea rubescens DSM 1968]
MSVSAVVPMESNPEVFTELAHKIGLSSVLAFNDVYSLTDPDLLSFIPRPCFAIILLFPITEFYETERKRIDSQSSELYSEFGENEKVLWFKQTIKNGCGLYALLHSIGNINDEYLQKDSTIYNFFKEAKNLNVKERADLVQVLEKSYSSLANQGQTEAPEALDDVSLHFISFVKSFKNDHVYELDGRRNSPIDLGQSISPENTDVLLEKNIIDKIQYYMDNADEANKYNFSMMALVPSF